MKDLFGQLQSRLSEMMKDENFSKVAKSAAVGGLAGLILYGLFQLPWSQWFA